MRLLCKGFLFSTMCLILIMILVGCQNNGTKKNNNDNNGQNIQETDENNHANTSRESSEQMVGEWSGAIQIPNEPLPVFISIENNDDMKGDMSIPVQGLKNHPFSSVEMSDGNVILTMDLQGQEIIFDGDITENHIEGTFTQLGQSKP